ncbi:hypothetical protein VPG91_07330 [Nitrospirillum amazonense]|uniref:hypothetical protein n=1 Tax=Nitrospirillum amazonense TaxID=28077 RepID=UPI002DD4228B|nr:hypothetical protein [Nitrospirillum amazonense]MEC4590793.1 hypothetical protein [Nitrospirillum amazonense]
MAGVTEFTNTRISGHGANIAGGIGSYVWGGPSPNVTIFAVTGQGLSKGEEYIITATVLLGPALPVPFVVTYTGQMTGAPAIATFEAV